LAYIGTKPTIGNFQICDAISVVNGQAAYTMQVGSVNVIPQSANHMIVSLNGTIQKPNSSYTVSGSTITFASNLVTNDVIDFIQILGDVLDLGVPSDATVTNAKISYPLAQSGAVVSQFNRTSDNGTIANFQKDGTVVGSLGTDSTGDFVIDGSSGHSGIRFKDTVLVPKQNGSDVDNTIDLGKSDKRWKDLYLGGGVFLGGTGTANKLDDYEEGTWTPLVDGASLGAVGYYKKIGKICLVHFGNQTNAALALNNGDDYDISGLPFSMMNDGGDAWKYGSVPSASFADATASYYSQPLTGRQNNSGAIHIMNRSGVNVSSSDPVNISMVYSTT